MLEPLPQAMTAEAFLVFEQASSRRHEWVGGYVYTQPDETGRHNRIAGNIAAHCLTTFQDGCRVYHIGMKLRAGDVFYYPDVMVVCDKPEPEPYYETDPCIAVEVLSPSTKDTDKREKMLVYKSMPSVQAYLLVDADALAVRHLWRDPTGHWQQQDLAGDGDIPLPCLNGVLTLPQIYRGVF